MSSNNKPLPQISNINRDDSKHRHRQHQQQQQNAPPSRPISHSSPPSVSYRTINTDLFDDDSNSAYSPNNFYNNNANSRTTERRDSHQQNIVWDHQQEQKHRQQIQNYQQYQKYNKPLSQTEAHHNENHNNNYNHNYSNNNNNNNNNHNNNVNDVNDDDSGDDEDVSDFFQNAYRPSSGGSLSKKRISVSTSESVIQSTTDRSPSSSASSRTLLQKDSLERSASQLQHHSNKINHNDIQDNVEMNVLNDQDKPLSHRPSKSYRPRPENPTPLSSNNEMHFPERPKSPSKGLVKMASIMKGNDSPNIENSNPPRRQKSLIRPERARRRISRSGAAYRYDDQRSDDESKRWSVFSGTGGDDRRKSTVSRRSSMKEPPRKRKWYKCQCPSCWVLFSRIITFWAPSSLLSCFGMHDKLVQQAWREKIALVSIILFLCIIVGFLTFGFRTALCQKETFENIQIGRVTKDQATILGSVYDLGTFQSLAIPENAVLSRADLSFLFQSTYSTKCKDVLIPKTPSDENKPLNYFSCVPVHENETPDPGANPGNNGCFNEHVANSMIIGDVFFEWDDVENLDRKYIVFNSQVLDLDRFQWTVPNIILPDTLNKLINDENDIFHGRDLTHYLSSHPELIRLTKCMEATVKVGNIDAVPLGCLISDIVTYVSLIVIVSVVLVRFFLAVLFGWVLSWRLGSFRESSEEIARRKKDIERWSNENNHYGRDSRPGSAASLKFLNKSRFSTPLPGSTPFVDRRRNENRSNGRNNYTTAMAKDSNGFGKTSRPSSEYNNSRANSLSSTSSSIGQTSSFPNLNFNDEGLLNLPFRPMHTIMLVTCYSEGLHGIRTTLNSLAQTDYPTSHKLIMVIADGIIFGSGNDLSTPDICLSLMSDFIVPVENVMSHSYVAIADGKKRHNMAKVYAGYYKCKDLKDPQKIRKTPMVTVVKCGGPEEQDDKKPGNRGKRDSQMILMSFLQKVMFDERMTPLEYEFFNSIRTVTGVTPDYFEIVLMVDADTKIYPDSVTRMVACMSNDSSIMGICGETKIANKSDSWVTMIQVFEYYISHHMQKAFESIFGGVTCLPGCFCMYRIKAPKGPSGYWVPILANPDIVEQYSENIVDTLHKKNLLLLGEDRYLSTLMLRTFPKRKMMFVPQAVCKTIVPNTFRVLRSQRRRWINSTVHNLLELVLIPDLCGTFCFSMQFVIFMELVGTVVLPAAISFTLYLIIISFITKPVPYVPLALLAVVLGLPAILILLTTRKIVYVGWMLIYLVSLPIWNFLLPVYAYWHFDDFSWGQTRRVEGEEVGADHSRKEGEFDSTKIIMKRWAEWEREKQLKSKNQTHPQQISSAFMSPEERFSNSMNPRPSVQPTYGGNEKPLSYQSTTQPIQSPLNPLSRTGNKRITGTTGIGVGGRTHATDSLMIPPPLSNSPRGSANITNFTPGTEMGDYQQHSNYDYNDGEHDDGYHRPISYEEAHLRHHNNES